MITFRSDWVYKLLKERPGGISAFADNWPGSSPKARETLYRWLKRDMEVPPEQVLALARGLDLDPIALYEVSPDVYETLCFRLIRGAFSPKSDPIMANLVWLSDIVAPGRVWPPETLLGGDKYSTGNWTWRDFSHAARDGDNFFQKLQISVHRSKFLTPQVWHFAFRRGGEEGSMWRPYGFVVRENTHIALYHVRGGTSFAEIGGDCGSFVVETWCGAGSADFRIASLHPFDLQAVAASALPSVRFS